MIELTASGTLGAPGFVRHLHARSRRRVIVLDLAHVAFCEPLGLVAVAALADRGRREGDRVIVRAPRDGNVANYLARMRLGSVLSTLGADHDLPYVREHDVGDHLFELTSFEGTRGAGALAAMLHQAVESVDVAAANALHDGVAELGQNVDQHSGQRRGFIAAQRTHLGRRLYFAVGDSGRGMLANLGRKGLAANDREALREALRPGISSRRSVSRGAGLPDVLDNVSTLGGHLHILSGSASVTAIHGRRWYGGGQEVAYPGTAVQGWVSTT